MMDIDKLRDLMGRATPGPWAYRPEPHDDWGVVRSGRFWICQAHDPDRMDDEFLAECRKTKTDPWYANAALISMSPDLAAEVLRLTAERDAIVAANQALVTENARRVKREEDARGVVRALLKRDEINTCQHENTHRGGFLWEICEDCGGKWADDMGGKPTWKDPAEWIAARAFLERDA